MIFVAENFIAMEHSAWQLVLFPRSNGIAILSHSCNTMCVVATITNATMLLVAILTIGTTSCVAFVFYARRERHSIATHQN